MSENKAIFRLEDVAIHAPLRGAGAIEINSSCPHPSKWEFHGKSHPIVLQKTGPPDSFWNAFPDTPNTID
jgi:hypothetical protein